MTVDCNSTRIDSDFIRRSDNPFPGTNRNLKTKTFRARIRIAGRLVYLGYFATREAATAAYQGAKRAVEHIQQSLPATKRKRGGQV